jgi:aspartyl-tRNA(Asn)/glutamyl-tRNA(Gln) amidotransferase subunit C
MNMIDRETVLKVAKLAKLSLSEDEITTFGSQLSVILENIYILQEADVSGVPPTAHASRQSNVMRDDIPQASYPPEVILANAPEQDDNYLKVNAILEDE